MEDPSRRDSKEEQRHHVVCDSGAAYFGNIWNTVHTIHVYAYIMHLPKQVRSKEFLIFGKTIIDSNNSMFGPHYKVILVLTEVQNYFS